MMIGDMALFNRMHICIHSTRFGINHKETSQRNNHTVRKLFRVVLWTVMFTVASFLVNGYQLSTVLSGFIYIHKNNLIAIEIIYKVVLCTVKLV